MLEAHLSSASSRKNKKKPRFVLHKHWATHLHWDFRLEKDGFLKSWAIPKGLPDRPGIRRLAIQVEDHELDYIDFQGTISKGYGAGKVKIADQGNYELIEFTSKKIRLILKGKKYHGCYNLFKINDKQWLINKLRNNKGLKKRLLTIPDN